MFVAFGISLVFVFVRQMTTNAGVYIIAHSADFVILFLLWIHLLLPLKTEKYAGKYFQQYRISIILLAVFSAFFIIVKVLQFLKITSYDFVLVFEMIKMALLSVFVFMKIKQLSQLTRKIILNPAQTLMISFLLVIFVGMMLLMLPTSTATHRLSFIEALFTATSAVCVTGLTIIDVGTRLNMAGQFILAVLIQIGGLGFMVLSFFGIMTLHKKISVEDKMTVSYVLSEDDMSGLLKTLRVIISSTFAIEAVAAFFLFFGFARHFGYGFKAMQFAAFHSVSAFCNAGFALFSDSLESFTADPLLGIIVPVTIILGGISFGVINELTKKAKTAAGNIFQNRKRNSQPLSLNTRVVLASSGILLLVSFVFIYFLEHTNTMKDFSLGKQYLATFFQAVTLRTAGFSTVSFAGMRNASLFFMIFMMFIGGASGSTAGGVKVNTIATVFAFFKSFLRQEKQTRINNMYIAFHQVEKAFLILGFGLASIFSGAFLLTLTETIPFLPLFFEVVSAFATVGLSAGVTGELSLAGQYIIIVLMFIGRVGPLTILTAASKKRSEYTIEYPYGNLALG